jgi:uncharacterized protein (TIGR02246 family)
LRENERADHSGVSTRNQEDKLMSVPTGNRSIRLLVTAGLVLSGLPTERLLAEERSVDRDQISAVVSRWEDAWNRHDMRAFASLFHEDGVWILWTGDVWSGRHTIEEGHAAVHKTVFRNSTQRERIEELTFLSSDAAIVRFCSTLTGDERAPDKVIRSRKFIVMTQRQGAWKISWGQNTRLSDAVPDSDCFAQLRKSAGNAR